MEDILSCDCLNDMSLYGSDEQPIPPNRTEQNEPDMYDSLPVHEQSMDYAVNTFASTSNH